MAILLVLVPLAFLLGLAGLAAFIWALHNGQYEDLEGHANRILKPDDDQ
jgi:cbb3-type cytochrome oxidase maturation protein